MWKKLEMELINTGDDLEQRISNICNIIKFEKNVNDDLKNIEIGDSSIVKF